MSLSDVLIIRPNGKSVDILEFLPLAYIFCNIIAYRLQPKKPKLSFSKNDPLLLEIMSNSGIFKNYTDSGFEYIFWVDI